MTSVRTALTKQQNLMVGAICATYGLLYLGRVNVSVVLPLLAVEFDVSRAEIGILGTVFFWTYGLGNFINGQLGSQVNPVRLVALGLLVTALVNLAVGFQTSLVLMLALWAVNGFAQSTGWPPMLRILADRLDPSQVKRASTVLPFSYVTGTVVTWSLLGAIAIGDNWRLAFWFPGLVLLLTAAFWWKAGVDAPKSPATGIRASVIIAESRGVAFALLVAALAGFVRNGTIIWLPTYILDSGLISPSLVGAVAAVTQLVAIPGILLAHYRVTRTSRVLATATVMLGAAGFAFLLLAQTVDARSLVILCLAMMLLGGAFGLVTSSMPLLLAPTGRTSSIAGTINMMATFAGGLAGFSIGGLVEQSGWGAVFALWGGMLLLASVVTWRCRHAED